MKGSTRIPSLLLSVVLVVCGLAKPSNAAGNEEVVLIKSLSITSNLNEERISYQCTFRNLWTSERQPVNYPVSSAKWSGPVLWTHTLQFEPWRAGDSVLAGVEKLIESGFSDQLVQEFVQQGDQVLDWKEPDVPNGFFVDGTHFVHLPPLEVDNQHPFLSMVAGMSPSPDWFTGFHSYWLVDEVSTTWYGHLKIQVKPWDAGTDAGSTYTASDKDIDSAVGVTLITSSNAPEGGELLSADGSNVPTVGELECFLVVGNNDMILPDGDWFANPCCNETDTVNCGAALPDGSLPAISPEYSEVLGTGPATPEQPQQDGGSLLVRTTSMLLLLALLVVV